MIVRAQEIERRIEQPRLLQADEHRIGAVLGAQAAVAQPRARPARLFQPLGNADLGPEAAAALEDAQDVARLRDLEARQRIEKRHDALAWPSPRASGGGTVCSRCGAPCML